MASHHNKSEEAVTTEVDVIDHVPSVVPDTQSDDSELDGAEVAKEAIGGTVEELPPGYFRSANFVCTVIALCLGQICCYFGFVLPANVLSIINEDIGPDPNFVWTAMIVSGDFREKRILKANDCMQWNLTQAVSFVLVGRLSDLFGRRWFFIIGNSIGLVGASE